MQHLTATVLGVVVAVLAITASVGGRATVPVALDATLRNVIDDALNDLRDIILNGDPENGIPVLDPFEVEEQDFTVDKDGLHADGSVSHGRFTGLGAFQVQRSSISIGIIPPRATIKVAVNVPELLAIGGYQVVGEGLLNGNTVSIDGDGNFTLRATDLYFSTNVVVNAIGFTVRSIDVSLDLGSVFVEVTGAGAAGDLINAEAAARAEEWFADNRKQLEAQLAQILKDAIEAGLSKRRSIGVLILIAANA